MRKSDGELSLGCGITMLSVVFVPVFLLSIAGIVWGWSRIQLQHRLMSTAVETTGVIVSSEVEWLPGGKDQSTKYRPVVRYEYSVDGNDYESSTVSPVRNAGENAWAQDIVREFPVGKQANMYYDPTDPAVAFLKREYLPDPYIMATFGSLFAAFAIVFPASFFRPRPRLRASMAIGSFVICVLPLIATIKHYFDHVTPLHEQANIWSTVVLVLGVVPLFFAVRWWRLDPKQIAKKLSVRE